MSITLAPDAYIRVVIVRHARLELLVVVDCDLAVRAVRIVVAALVYSLSRPLGHVSVVSHLGVECIGGAPRILPHISRLDEVGPVVDGGAPVPEPPARAVV